MFDSPMFDSPGSPSTPRVRPAAVAGMFYPADPGCLRDLVRGLLDAAPPGPPGAPSRALILPHAGYVYSGAVAAAGYRQAALDGIARAVVIGPAHRVPVRGVAAAGADFLDTPLGRVTVPVELHDVLRERLAPTFPDLLVTSPAVHAREHSVEVHLPFLQVLAPDLPVLPLVAGDATPEEMTELISAVLADDDTLLVVSSDLSHFLTEEQATEVDADTLGRIASLGGPLPPRRACGAIPINGLLGHARRAGWQATVIGHATSADAPGGDPDRVVGYPAVRFDPIGPRLPGYARAVLEHELAGGPDPAGESAGLAGHPRMRAPGASFVTLTAGGRLRGCIGSLAATRPLADDIAAHAVDAAIRDPRFRPVTAGELPGLRIEVSVLSAPEPLDVRSEDEAVAALRPGVDGAILSGGPGPHARRGTFLPQVWEQLPDPRAFVRHLKRKAGLAAGTDDPAWGDGWRLERYGVEAWDEDAAGGDGR